MYFKMDYTNAIKEYVRKITQVMELWDIKELNRAINAIENARENNSEVIIFGNGGSASTASHMANDLKSGSINEERTPWKVRCLCDNNAMLTAIANDYGYENVFVGQLMGTLDGSELIVAISGSGNSINVIRAVEYARSQGCTIIALCGCGGGKLKHMADYCIESMIFDMEISEDLHLIFNHIQKCALGIKKTDNSSNG